MSRNEKTKSIIGYRVSGYDMILNSTITIEKIELFKVTESRIYITPTTYERKTKFSFYDKHAWFLDKKEAGKFFLTQRKNQIERLKEALVKSEAALVQLTSIIKE
jgi:uncharacterized protein with PIN domain